MIDDELDDILGNVDENNYKSARNESLRTDEKIARKSDRKILETSEISSKDDLFRYLKKTKSEIDFSDFKDGFFDILHKHEDYARHLKTTINDFSLDESIQQELSKYKYNFIRSIETIEKDYNKFAATNDLNSIEKKVKNEFYLFFQNDPTTNNKTNYLVIKEIFIRIREINSLLKKHWTELRNNIGIINSFSGGNDLHKNCNNIIDNAYSLIEKTSLFLEYLSNLLALNKEDFDVLEKEINKKILFFEDINYDYKMIFDDQLIESYKINKESDDKSIEKPKEQEKLEVIEQNEQKIEENKDKTSIKGFSVRGTQKWNTREPYIVVINSDKFQKDISDLKSSIYFNNEIPDPVKINGNVKRAMFKHMRDSTYNIKVNYDEFIYKIIIQKVQQIGEIYNKQNNDLYLLIYHLGPLSIYKIISEQFNKTQQGVCYKSLNGNKISRLIPFEFIKRKILEWFEENINTYPLEFDSITQFNEIKSYISSEYDKQYINNMQKIDQVVQHYMQKTGKQIDKLELFKNKVDDLYSIENKVIFKRFIEKSVFK